jgi:hypothetical protein
VTALRRAEAPGRNVEVALRDLIDIPEFLSPIDKLVIASDGTIWMRRNRFGWGGRDVWFVFDSGFNSSEIVELTREMDIIAVWQDQLWAVEQDEYEVPYLMSFRIVRASRVN